MGNGNLRREKSVSDWGNDDAQRNAWAGRPGYGQLHNPPGKHIGMPKVLATALVVTVSLSSFLPRLTGQMAKPSAQPSPPPAVSTPMRSPTPAPSASPTPSAVSATAPARYRALGVAEANETAAVLPRPGVDYIFFENPLVPHVDFYAAPGLASANITLFLDEDLARYYTLKTFPHAPLVISLSADGGYSIEKEKIGFDDLPDRVFALAGNDADTDISVVHTLGRQSDAEALVKMLSGMGFPKAVRASKPPEFGVVLEFTPKSEGSAKTPQTFVIHGQLQDTAPAAPDAATTGGGILSTRKTRVARLEILNAEGKSVWQTPDGCDLGSQETWTKIAASFNQYGKGLAPAVSESPAQRWFAARQVCKEAEDNYLASGNEADNARAQAAEKAASQARRETETRKAAIVKGALDRVRERRATAMAR